MLTITVLGDEVYNEATQEFDNVDSTVLRFEHSLVSVSKWESIHEKAFLTSNEKSTDEVVSYIEQMLLTENAPGDILQRLSEDNLKDINDYMGAKRTATWFYDPPNAGPRAGGETITSELIYYWLTALTIPFYPSETWHLNRLFTLIRVANVKNGKPKKMAPGEAAARQRSLNEQRRKELGTQG